MCRFTTEMANSWTSITQFAPVNGTYPQVSFFLKV